MENIPIAGYEMSADSLAAWIKSQGDNQILVVMGVPGAGKTKLCETLEKLGAQRINRDNIRKRVNGDEAKLGDWRAIDREYYKELKAALKQGGLVISDNVNITVAHRRATLEIAQEHGYTKSTVMWVNTPLDVCLQRNAARERHVDESVIRNMHAQMLKDGEPRETEGNLVVITSGKDKDHYRIEKVREGALAMPEKPAPVSTTTPPPKSPPKPPISRADIATKRRELSGDLKVQLNLLDACIAAGRDFWAVDTLAVIRDLSHSGITLFQEDVSRGDPAPSRTPATKKPPVQLNPADVTETLLKMIGHRPLATGDGPLIALSFNGHLLTLEKAKLLIVPILELVRRAHVICFQETNVDALRFIAKAAKGYGLIASHRNVREQACGILFHSRLHWLGQAPVYHDYLLDVPGHPEFKASLRPAIQRRVRDLATGWIFDVICKHDKSNLGGPDATRPIRRWGNEALIAELGRQTVKSPYEARVLAKRAPKPAETGKESARSPFPDDSGSDLPLGPVIIGGDYNAPIENPATTEMEPITNAGFVRVSTADKRWSYQYRGNGGQFDGFFARGLDGLIPECFIPEFFPKENKRDGGLYAELSDHLPVFIVINPPVVPAPAATTTTQTPPSPVVTGPTPAGDSSPAGVDVPPVSPAVPV